MERLDARRLFSRFTHVLRSSFRGEDPREVAATVLQNVALLSNGLGNINEIAHIRAAILSDQQSTSSIGSARDIDTTINLIEARVRGGTIASDVASKYLDILNKQRALNLHERSQPGQHLGDRIAGTLSTRVSRREFAAIAMVGITGIVTISTLSTEPTTPPVNPNELLDSRPKEQLTEDFSDLSNRGWRAKHAPGSIAQEYISDGRVHVLENGFNFSFGEDHLLWDWIFGNGIAIRAVRAPDGTVIPFLRITPIKGTPKDYVMDAASYASGNLITRPVIFENPAVQTRYITQFQILDSGEDFTFLGTYLTKQLSLKNSP